MRLMVLLAALALSLEGATHYVIVSGLGGEPDYEQRFAGWAQTIDQVLRASRTDATIETLSGAAATRDRVRGALEKAVADCGPADAFVLMLIGHGAFDGYEYKFNLPGPDISAGELAGLLNRLRAERQLVVDTTSASGGALEALRKENRVVISATKSGTEKNATVFARYWAEALRDPSADTDKNEAMTALEAFRLRQHEDRRILRIAEAAGHRAPRWRTLAREASKAGRREGWPRPSPCCASEPPRPRRRTPPSGNSWIEERNWSSRSTCSSTRRPPCRRTSTRSSSLRFCWSWPAHRRNWTSESAARRPVLRGPAALGPDAGQVPGA